MIFEASIIELSAVSKKLQFLEHKSLKLRKYQIICKRKMMHKIVDSKLKILLLQFYELCRVNFDLIYLQMKQSRVVL